MNIINLRFSKNYVVILVIIDYFILIKQNVLNIFKLTIIKIKFQYTYLDTVVVSKLNARAAIVWIINK